jgi:2-desacetyl-2-hydroxyethyl bacteriochlorophyllide A dehydrogenase
MRAAVFYGVKDLRLETLDLTKLKPDEILIKVAVCGVCGTDLHIYEGAQGSAPVSPPVILGHEFSGEVVDFGKQVQQWKIGERVSVDPNIHCGICNFCRSGKIHLCENLRAVGVTQNGGFAEYAIVPENAAYLLPDNVSFEEGTMAEPLACCLHGIDLAGIKHGDNVVIIGGGTIGLMMIQLAKLAGAANIIVSEPIQEKWHSLKIHGADFVIDPANGNMDEQVNEITRYGADVVVECVGLKETMIDAVSACKKGGTVMMFGLASPDCEIPLRPFEVFQKELTIKSSFVNPFTQSRALSLLSSGKIRVSELFAEIIELEKIKSAFEDAAFTLRGKILIKP